MKRLFWGSRPTTGSRNASLRFISGHNAAQELISYRKTLLVKDSLIFREPIAQGSGRSVTGGSKAGQGLGTRSSRGRPTGGARQHKAGGGGGSGVPQGPPTTSASPGKAPPERTRSGQPAGRPDSASRDPSGRYGPDAGLAGQILAAIEWRQLAELTSRVLAATAVRNGAHEVAEYGAAAGSAPGASGGGSFGVGALGGLGSGQLAQPGDGRQPSGEILRRSVASADAGAEVGAAPGHQLGEWEFLLLLWRVVCGHLQMPGRAGGLAPQPPPPLPAPPAPASGGVAQSPWVPGGGLPPPLRPSPSPAYPPSLSIPPTFPLPSTSRQPAPLDAVLAFTDPGTTLAVPYPGSAPPLGLGTPEAASASPLEGTSIARRRCVDATVGAATQLAPSLSLRGLVAALLLVSRLADAGAASLPAAAAGGADTTAAGAVRNAFDRGRSREGAGDAAAAAALIAPQLAEPLLKAAAVRALDADPGDVLALVALLPILHRHVIAAAGRLPAGTGAGSVAGAAATAAPQGTPLTHAVLAAALDALNGRAQLVMPTLHELCVCAAAAAGCDYLPAASWLALLRSELRNQLFLVTATQGAVVLASLDHLAAQAARQLVESDRDRDGEGAGGLPDSPMPSGSSLLKDEAASAAAGVAAAAAASVLPPSWEQVLWAEVRGKAAAAVVDVSSCTEALLELAWFQDAGLLPADRTSVGRRFGPSDPPGSRRVRYLHATLCAGLAPQLAACSGGQLAVVLCAVARVPTDEGAVSAQPAVAMAAAGGGAVVPQAGSPWRRVFLGEAAGVVLHNVRAGSLGFRELAACVVALAALAAPLAANTATASLPPPSPALAALLEAAPDALERCLLAAATGPVAASAAAAASAALGPEDLAWLPRVEAALLSLEAVAARPPRQSERPEQLGQQRPGPEAAFKLEAPPIVCSARGLADRALRGLMAALGGMEPEVLLQLAAASCHPWTAHLFSQAARRDVLLALLTSTRSTPSVAKRGVPATPTSVLCAAVRALDADGLLAVLCAATDRQWRLRDVRSLPPQRRQHPGLPKLDAVTGAVLHSALPRLLELAVPDNLPGYMDEVPQPGSAAGPGFTDERAAAQGGWAAPGCFPRGRRTQVLGPAQWCAVVEALASVAPALLPAAGGTLTPATVLQLLRALESVWPQLGAEQAVGLVSSLSALYGPLQVAAASGRGTAAAGGAVVVVSEGAPSAVRHGGADAAPAAEDWHVVQRSAAVAMAGVTPRGLSELVFAAAQLAAVAPLCDQWMEALTVSLLGSPPLGPWPSLANDGCLAELDARTALELLRGCIELKAAAADQSRVMLPVLPLLEHFVGVLLQAATPPLQQRPQVQQVQQQANAGATVAMADTEHPVAAAAGAPMPLPCADVCRLLPCLAALATEPAPAAVLGTTCTPLLLYLQLHAFRGARLGDILSALQGTSRLMLRPNPDWAAALCAATLPVVRDRTTQLSDLAGLAYGMAQAWVVPTAEWRGALEAASVERLGAPRQGGGGGGRGRLTAGSERALEQLLWAQALWCRRGAGAGAGSPAAGADGEGGGLRPSAQWLDALVAASVPLLPTAKPQALASLPYLLGVLGHDPGPDFIAALLPSCTTALPALTGPQLSRLAHGLATLGYQPEDPWVADLQRHAAQRLRECDAHELGDLLEGVLLLAEGSGADRLEGGTGVAGAGAGAGAGAAEGGGGGRVADPRIATAFLQAFWDRSAEVLRDEGALLAAAVSRRARRADLQRLQRLNAKFRRRTADPRVGSALRYWTEQVPFLDPSLAADPESLSLELVELAAPMFDGPPGSDPEAMPRLQRFLTWAALSDGKLPEPLPEGLLPWVGRLVVRCVELLGGPRAGNRSALGAEMQHMPGASSPGEGRAEALEAAHSLQQQERWVGPVPVVLWPSEEWLSALLVCEAGSMLLGGGEMAQRHRLLELGRALLAWEAPPSAEWGEAFLQASRKAFFSDAGPSARHDQGPQDGTLPGVAASDGLGAVEEPATGPSATPTLEPAARDRSSSSERRGGPNGGGLDGEPGLGMWELLQLLSMCISLDLAPGPSWLAAAEVASLPLLRGCQPAEGVALAVAFQRLRHEPGRQWAAELLTATRQEPGAAPSAPSAVSMAALLVALCDMRIRPSNSWIDGVLVCLHGRHDELPAQVRARLLAALAFFEVQLSAEWLAPLVEAFWDCLPELLSPTAEANILIGGLSALSTLEVPVKQQQLTALLKLMSERLNAVTVPATGLGSFPSRAAGAVAASATASAVAADLARVLICLAGMRRATPSRANRQVLDALFATVADLLPVAGALTPKLLDSWDQLVPIAR